MSEKKEPTSCGCRIGVLEGRPFFDRSACRVGELEALLGEAVKAGSESLSPYYGMWRGRWLAKVRAVLGEGKE